MFGAFGGLILGPLGFSLSARGPLPCLPVDSGSLVCGTPKIFDAMKEVISKYDDRLEKLF